MLTKKDFVAIAGALRYAYATADKTPEAIASVKATEDEVVKIFAASNPRFDEDRFRNACNPREMDHASS